MSAHVDIMALVDAYSAENDKFMSGNAAAGTRARKALADLAKAVKARRTEITELKASRKAEKEVKKVADTKKPAVKKTVAKKA